MNITVIGTGYGIVGYGIVTEMVAAFGAQATLGAAGSVGGAGANIMRSLALAGGSPGGGGKATVASPTGAPNSSTARSGTQATATNRPLQVLQEQGRSPESYVAGPKNAIPCKTKEYCDQIAWEFALGGPFMPGAIVAPEGAASGRVLINLLKSILPKSTAELLAEKAALIVAKLPASTFKIFECSQCANTIVKALQKAGISGQTLKVTANHGAEFIVSDLYKGGASPITQNGRHYAVQVGDMVFDNLNKSGVLREIWEKALHSPFGHTIEATPF